MLSDDGVLTKEQETFLEKAVAGLAQEDKVISVRLALFAEMVKSKPWTRAQPGSAVEMDKLCLTGSVRLLSPLVNVANRT